MIGLYSMGDPLVTESYLAWIVNIFSYDKLQVSYVTALGVNTGAALIVATLGPEFGIISISAKTGGIYDSG